MIELEAKFFILTPLFMSGSENPKPSFVFPASRERCGSGGVLWPWEDWVLWEKCEKMSLAFSVVQEAMLARPECI
jgi:hypothetical protein